MSSRDKHFELFVCLIVLAMSAAIAIAVFSQINNLDKRVTCLEHPHQESSVAAKIVGGKVVVTRPAHKTGCP